MSKQIAFLFPGQGSQYVGMGFSFYQEYELARSIFVEAEEILGIPLRKYCFEGPIADLTKTQIAQPAILTVEYLIYRILTAEGVEPTWVAGHSLGEYGALVAAGALSFADSLKLVQKRADYMAAIPVPGAMAAILNYPRAELEALIDELATEGVIELANYNSPAQIVVSGERHLVEKLVTRIKESKTGKAIPLAVEGAFHSRLMRPAAQRFRADLERTSFSSPTTPILANVTAETVTLAAQLPQLLEQQIYSPVRWQAITEKLFTAGCQLFLEVGGKVLSGLVKKTCMEANTVSLREAEDLKKYLQK
ncbi:MAG TPA: ACP S-malonyltransferase [Firmicutes bacterium]|jgi:[acyl-carrier-protein] S-malonyltransferase|nr:ACP S-malonyltransferase [Bacillota bacterium]